MGWLYSERWQSSSEMRDHLGAQLKESGYEILKDALVGYGRRYYAAIRFVGDPKPGVVEDVRRQPTVFVALIEGGKHGGFGYKDMDESMGPYEVDCPLSVLDAAGPDAEAPNEWAKEWRAKVRAYHAQQAAAKRAAKAVRPGDKVHARGSHSPYTVFSVGKAITGYGTDGVLYRIPKTWIMSVESTSAASGV